MVDDKDIERKEFIKALRYILSKPRKPQIQAYDQEFLDEYRKIQVEPKITEAKRLGIDALKSNNMTDFVLSISRIAQVTENFVDYTN